MKKFFGAVFAAVVMCVSFFCLFGCNDAKLDGKYLFQSATAGIKGGDYIAMVKGMENVEGYYDCVVGGKFESENYWVEVKGNTLTVHGLITPFESNGIFKFTVAEGEYKIENFTLDDSNTGPGKSAFYRVVDSNGEKTPWTIHRKGESVFYQLGSSGVTDTWSTFDYHRA